MAYTPGQKTNLNNQVYKKGTDVFRVSDNAAIKMGATDSSLDWNKLGLNFEHINTLEDIPAAPDYSSDVIKIYSENFGRNPTQIELNDQLRGLKSGNNLENIKNWATNSSENISKTKQISKPQEFQGAPIADNNIKDPVAEKNKIDEAANAEAEKELQLIMSETNKVDLSKSTALMDKITEMLNTKPPEEKSLSEQFLAKKASLGVDPLEATLNEKDSALKKLDADFASTLEDEEGRLVSVGQIERRQSKEGVAYARMRRDLVAERDSIANQLNSKYATLNTMMELTKADYQTANTNYQFQYNKAITLMGLLQGEEDKITSQKDKAQDNARANVQIMAGLLKENNMDYSKLGTQKQIDIKKMELMAGLPSGFLQYVSKEVKDPIVSTLSQYTNSAGKRIQPLLTKQENGAYKVENIELGMDETKKGSGGGGLTQTDDIEQNAQAVFEGRLKLTGVPIKIRSAVDKKVQELKQNSDKYDSEFEARVDYDQEISQLYQAKSNNQLEGTPSEIITSLVNSYGKRISSQEIQATVYNLFGVSGPKNSSSGKEKIYSLKDGKITESEAKKGESISN